MFYKGYNADCPLWYITVRFLQRFDMTVDITMSLIIGADNQVN